MNTATTIIGTAVAVGSLFTAWLFHLEYLYLHVNLYGNILLFLLGCVAAVGVWTVIISITIRNW